MKWKWKCVAFTSQTRVFNSLMCLKKEFFQSCFANPLSSPLSVLSIHPACFPFLSFSPQTIYHSLSAGGLWMCLYGGVGGEGGCDPLKLSIPTSTQKEWENQGKGERKSLAFICTLARSNDSHVHFTFDSYINHTRNAHTCLLLRASVVGASCFMGSAVLRFKVWAQVWEPIHWTLTWAKHFTQK